MADSTEQWWYFLCRTVFHCSVKELKGRITYLEFIGWIQYYKLKPFGDDWQQTATLGHLISIPASEHKLRKPIEEPDLIPHQKNARFSRLLSLKHKLDEQRKRQ